MKTRSTDYFGCFDDADYSSIKHQGGHYDVRDLERALVIPQRDRAVIAKWKELAEDQATIAFCCSHEHSRRASSAFNRAGIRSEVHISSTSSADRLRLLQDLANGRLKILCAVDVLNEGADIPFVECLLFLRPTESRRIFYQQLARGLRMFAGKGHCTVFDFTAWDRPVRYVQGLLPVGRDGKGYLLIDFGEEG